MSVHDIEMQPVGSAFFAGLDFIGESREIGGEEARGNSDRLGAGSHGRDHTCHRILNLDVPQRVLMLEDSERMLAIPAGSCGTANLFGALWTGFHAAYSLGQTGAREPREQTAQNHDARQRHRRLEPTVRHQSNPDCARQQNPECCAEATEYVASQTRSERQQQCEPEKPRAEQNPYRFRNRIQSRPKLIP
jgi:hypothetical protein